MIQPAETTPDKIEEYDQDIELNPNDAEVYYDQGIAKIESAIEDFDRALEIGIRALKIGINDEDDMLAKAYLNRGLTKVVLGDHHGARKDFDQVLLHDHTSHSDDNHDELAAAYYCRCAATRVLGDLFDVMKDFDCAIDLEPEFKLPETYIKRGRMKAKAKRGNYNYYGAIADCLRAMELYFDSGRLLDEAFLFGSEAYLWMGIAKAKLGKYRDAIIDLDYAIEFTHNGGMDDWRHEDDWSIAEAYLWKGAVKAKLGDQADAISYYERAIELDPDEENKSLAYHWRGDAKSKLKDHKGARKDYDYALASNPKNAEAYFARGDAKRLLGNRKSARKDYVRALRWDSSEAMVKRVRERIISSNQR